jgi:hypothetical protein
MMKKTLDITIIRAYGRSIKNKARLGLNIDVLFGSLQ